MIFANTYFCGPSSSKHDHFAYLKTSLLCNLVYQSVSNYSHSIDGSGLFFIVSDDQIFDFSELINKHALYIFKQQSAKYG